MRANVDSLSDKAVVREFAFACGAKDVDNAARWYAAAPYYAYVCPDRIVLHSAIGHDKPRERVEQCARVANDGDCPHPHIVVAIHPNTMNQSLVLNDRTQNCWMVALNWEADDPLTPIVQVAARAAYDPRNDTFVDLDAIFPTTTRAQDLASLGALLREAQVICDRLEVQPFLPLPQPT